MNEINKNTLKFSDMGIIDDNTSYYGFKSIKPVCITDIIDYINKILPTQEDKDMIEIIDISSNHIGFNGILQFFDFISNNLPNVKSIDISNNRLSKPTCYCCCNYDEYNKKLLEFLNKETIKEIYVDAPVKNKDHVQKSIDRHFKIKNT